MYTVGKNIIKLSLSPSIPLSTASRPIFSMMWCRTSVHRYWVDLLNEKSMEQTVYWRGKIEFISGILNESGDVAEMLLKQMPMHNEYKSLPQIPTLTHWKTLIMCWECKCVFFLCPQVHKRKCGLKSTCKIEPHASLILSFTLSIYLVFPPYQG